MDEAHANLGSHSRGRVRIYCAISLDGYIAGDENGLDWLEGHGDEGGDLGDGDGVVTFAQMLEWTGVMLMGRTTYEVVQSFGVEWPYKGLDVWVVTHRPLAGEVPEGVSAVSGELGDLVERARSAAGERGVYLDGGGIMTQALDAGCVDEMILTVAPVVLGSGVALYQGENRHRFTLVRCGRYGAMAQMVLAAT